MKNERYEFLLKYLESSFEGERNFIANLANASAVINQNLENLKVISVDLEKQRVGLSLR